MGLEWTLNRKVSILETPVTADGGLTKHMELLGWVPRLRLNFDHGIGVASSRKERVVSIRLP